MNASQSRSKAGDHGVALGERGSPASVSLEAGQHRVARRCARESLDGREHRLLVRARRSGRSHKPGTALQALHPVAAPALVRLGPLALLTLCGGGHWRPLVQPRQRAGVVADNRQTLRAHAINLCCACCPISAALQGGFSQRHSTRCLAPSANTWRSMHCQSGKSRA